LVLAFCISCFANIAPAERPKTKPAKSIDTTLSIRLDKNAKDARLIIPKSAIKELRAQLDQIDSDEVTTAAAVSGITRTQTIVGGLFLSMAIVFGGVWFTRSGGMTSKIAAIVALLMASGAVATLVYANAGPPPEARSINGKMFTPAVHMYGFGSGKVKLETSDEVGVVTLIVPDPETPKPGEEE
jgi:hypothetical protein